MGVSESMKTIYLIGFMGCGKSTVGQHLSKAIGGKFVDSDQYIEEKHGQVIADIFKAFGEDTFRTYESEALKELGTYDVVSTGGGIVERRENLHSMNKNGTIVYLETPFDEIVERLKSDVTRPLWNSNEVDKMKALYNRRIKLYEQFADVVINTDGKTIEVIVSEIVGLKKNKN